MCTRGETALFFCVVCRSKENLARALVGEDAPPDVVVLKRDGKNAWKAAQDACGLLDKGAVARGKTDAKLQGRWKVDPLIVVVTDQAGHQELLRRMPDKRKLQALSTIISCMRSDDDAKPGRDIYIVPFTESSTSLERANRHAVGVPYQDLLTSVPWLEGRCGSSIVFDHETGCTSSLTAALVLSARYIPEDARVWDLTPHQYDIRSRQPVLPVLVLCTGCTYMCLEDGKDDERDHMERVCMDALYLATHKETFFPTTSQMSLETKKQLHVTERPPEYTVQIRARPVVYVPRMCVCPVFVGVSEIMTVCIRTCVCVACNCGRHSGIPR